MTDKLIMTTAERDELLHALSVPEHADEGENAAAITVLQSLPMVEPTEYLLRGMRVKLNFNKMGNMTSLADMEHDLQGRWVSFVGAENDKHLKTTSPQALTPITADDVTNEMLDTYIADISQHKLMDVKIDVVAVCNAVVQHRSEAK